MIARLTVALIIMTGFLSTSCSTNILKEFGAESDESLLFDAEELMNGGDWTAAISKFGELSTDFRSRRDVRLKEAKAYAGRCGLELVALAESIANAGATSLMTLLMRALTGATSANSDDCIEAENLILQINASPAQRTADENVTMAFVEFAKIGAILSSRADANADGIADWGNNASCTVGNGSNAFLTNLEAGHLATGLAIAIASLAAAGSTIGGASATAFNSVCTFLANNIPAANFCGATDPTTLTANQILGIRTLVQEGVDGIGLGTCTDTPDNMTNCLCP